MLDQILGRNNLQSEIIWKRTTAKSLAFKGYPNNHDTIFYYGGGGELAWNRPFIEYDFDSLDEKTEKKYWPQRPRRTTIYAGGFDEPKPRSPESHL